MSLNRQPAAHQLTSALQRILSRTETLLQRRTEGVGTAVDPDDLSTGMEVEDADWEAWVEAGGDLLMGRRD